MIRILPLNYFLLFWGTAEGKIYFLLNRRQSANLLSDAKIGEYITKHLVGGQFAKDF